MARPIIAGVIVMKTRLPGNARVLRPSLARWRRLRASTWAVQKDVIRLERCSATASTKGHRLSSWIPSIFASSSPVRRKEQIGARKQPRQFAEHRQAAHRDGLSVAYLGAVGEERSFCGRRTLIDERHRETSPCQHLGVRDADQAGVRHDDVAPNR